MDEIRLPEEFEFLASACHLAEPCYTVRALVKEDLGMLMPFLNATAKVLQYEPGEEPVMIFRFDRFKVALRSHEISLAPFSDRKTGAEALSMLIEFLNKVLRKRDKIAPNFTPRRRPPAFEIYKLLPRTNCKACGEMTCMAFAVKLALGRLEPSSCPFLKKDPGNLEKLYSLLGLDSAAV